MDEGGKGRWRVRTVLVLASLVLVIGLTMVRYPEQPQPSVPTCLAHIDRPCPRGGDPEHEPYVRVAGALVLAIGLGGLLHGLHRYREDGLA